MPAPRRRPASTSRGSRSTASCWCARSRACDKAGGCRGLLPRAAGDDPGSSLLKGSQVEYHLFLVADPHLVAPPLGCLGALDAGEVVFEVPQVLHVRQPAPVP